MKLSYSQTANRRFNWFTASRTLEEQDQGHGCFTSGIEDIFDNRFVVDFPSVFKIATTVKPPAGRNPYLEEGGDRKDEGERKRKREDKTQGGVRIPNKKADDDLKG